MATEFISLYEFTPNLGPTGAQILRRTVEYLVPEHGTNPSERNR